MGSFMKDPLKLQQAHRHVEAIAEYKRRLAVDPDDFASVSGLADALLSAGAYRDSLPAMERIGAHERQCMTAGGHPGYQIEIACLHWLMGNRLTAMMLMRGACQGIRDRSIKYGDLAGGVHQGLLFYYMGITADDAEFAGFAANYLYNRARRAAAKSWPGPLARYYLDEVDFAHVLEKATGQRTVPEGDSCRPHRSAQTSAARQRAVSRCGQAAGGGRRGAMHGANARMLRSRRSADRARTVSRPA